MSQPFIVGKAVAGKHCRPGQGDQKDDRTESQSVMTVLVFKVQLESHLMREPKPLT